MWTVSLSLLLAATALAGPGDRIKICTDEVSSGDLAPVLTRTVRVQTANGSGSGAVISPDGLIVTAEHVVADTTDVTIVYANEREVAGTVVRRAPEADLALVRVDDPATACLPVRIEPLTVGSEVRAIGNPGGKVLTQTVTKGIVSAYRETKGIKILQTDASINAGNSGGPILDEHNHLVAVVSYKLVGQGVEGLGFGVASDGLAPILGFEWSSEETVGLAEAAPVEAPLEPWLRYQPVVEPGDGVSIESDLRYVQVYRPRPTSLATGALLLVAGSVMIASSNRAYQDATAMSEAEWNKTVTKNTIGWAGLYSGLGMIGLGLVPSPKAPVEVKR